MTNKKLIIIIGPTASGKSALAVSIALRLGSRQAKKRYGINGAEIISADSRQVYKGLDVGSGKITKREMQGIRHHLLNAANPKRTFTVAHYKKLARKAIAQVWQRGKIPILCGGTGFYIQAAVDGLVLPEVKPNHSLRRKLEKKSAAELFKILLAKDKRRAMSIDRQNKRRLIRAIEITNAIGKVPPKKLEPLEAEVIFIGVKKEREELNKLIEGRLQKSIPGIIQEIQKLLRSGVSSKRLESFGLEYKWGTKFVKKEISKEEFFANLLKAIRQYAKRQMTWFRKVKNIKWVTNAKEAEILVRRFLQK